MIGEVAVKTVGPLRQRRALLLRADRDAVSYAVCRTSGRRAAHVEGAVNDNIRHGSLVLRRLD